MLTSPKHSSAMEELCFTKINETYFPASGELEYLSYMHVQGVK